MYFHTKSPVTLPGDSPLEKERNQILLQANEQMEKQSKIISEQAAQIKELTESVKRSADEAKQSSESSKKSAKWSFVVSCIMGGIAFATLAVEVIRLCLDL